MNPIELKFRKLKNMERYDLVLGIAVRFDVCNKMAHVGIIRASIIKYSL